MYEKESDSAAPLFTDVNQLAIEEMHTLIWGIMRTSDKYGSP